MSRFFNQKLFSIRIFSSLLIFVFGLNTLILPVSAQGVTAIVPISSATISLIPHLVGLAIHSENPFVFDFILDRGQGQPDNQSLRSEGEKLIKYFLTTVTIPDHEAWVNLSPYESQKIIPQALGQTQMGQVMLEQDFQLKQLTASLTNPNTELGKKYWERIKNQSSHEGETLTPSLSTLSRVWIVPDGAEVFERNGFVYITASRLTVMMPEDNVLDAQAKAFKQIILPELQKAVNDNALFAPIRQVYQSVILAVWYKRNLKNSILSKTYADQSKIKGVDIANPKFKDEIYQQYLAAFRKGAYQVIQEVEDRDGQVIPQKFVSGGITQLQEVKMTASSANRFLNEIQAAAGHLSVINSQLQDSIIAGSPIPQGFNLVRINFLYSRVHGVIEAIRMGHMAKIEENLLTNFPQSPRVKEFIRILKDDVNAQVDILYETPGPATADHILAVQNLLADDKVYDQYSDLYDEVIKIFDKSSLYRQAHLQIQGELVAEALGVLPESAKRSFLQYAQFPEEQLVLAAYQITSPSFGKLVDELVNYTDNFLEQSTGNASSGIDDFLRRVIARVVGEFYVNNPWTLEEMYKNYFGDDINGPGTISALAATALYGREDLVMFVKKIANEYSGEGTQVLSVGMGNGTFEQELQEAGLDVVGLDIFKPFADAAKANGVPSVVYQGNTFPFKDQSFSMVLFPESLEHMKMKTAFLEAKRVLKPGGKIVIITALKDDRHMYDIELDYDDLKEGLTAAEFGGIRFETREKPSFIGPVTLKFISASKPLHDNIKVAKASAVVLNDADREALKQAADQVAQNIFTAFFPGGQEVKNPTFARELRSNPIKLLGTVDSIGGQLLGIGTEGPAIKLTINGKEIVIKILPDSNTINTVVKSMESVNDVPLFQHYLAHGDRWIASDFISGESFPEDDSMALMGPQIDSGRQEQYDARVMERISKIPDEHWDQLIQIFVTQHLRKIYLDPMAGNFIYEPQRGFVAIDYAFDGRVRSRISLSYQLLEQKIIIPVLGAIFASPKVHQTIQAKVIERLRAHPEFGVDEQQISSASTAVTNDNNPASSDFEKGGIDFDSDKVKLTMNRDPNSVQISSSSWQYGSFQIEGLTPIILSIQPFSVNAFSVLNQK